MANASLLDLSRQVRLHAADDLCFVTDWIDRFASHDTAQQVHAALKGWLEERGPASDRFTVVLYGRTMAGKSTLAEALICGDGRSIGNGRQRTTRTARMHDTDQLRLVDVPGIGAFAGEQDAAVARARMAAADLVIFLLTDDGLPAAVLEELAHVRATGTPTLFVLNVKDDLEPPTDRALWIEHPDRCFEERQVDELRADIIEQAQQLLGIPRPQVLHLHALATLEASRGEKALAGAGRLTELTKLIEVEAREYASARRSRAILDGASHQFSCLAAEVKNQRSMVVRQLDVVERSYTKLSEDLRTCAEELPASIRGQVIGAFGALSHRLGSWLEKHIHLDQADLDAAWQHRIEGVGLDEKIEKTARNAIARIEEILETTGEDLSADLDELCQLDLGDLILSFDGGRNWHLAAKYGRWALTATFFIPGPGTAAAIAVRATGALLVQGLAWMQRRLPHTMTQRQKHIEKTRRKLNEFVDEQATATADALTEQIVAQTGYQQGSTRWDPSTAGGSLVTALQARADELRHERDELRQLADHLEAARWAVDARLIERLTTAVTGESGTVTLVDRQRGERTLVRGDVNADALRQLTDLLDETVERVAAAASTHPSHS